VCVDRHSARVDQLRATLSRLGASFCEVVKADSTRLVADEGENGRYIIIGNIIENFVKPMQYVGTFDFFGNIKSN
jgi:hypothetical protein